MFSDHGVVKLKMGRFMLPLFLQGTNFLFGLEFSQCWRASLETRALGRQCATKRQFGLSWKCCRMNGVSPKFYPKCYQATILILFRMLSRSFKELGSAALTLMEIVFSPHPFSCVYYVLHSLSKTVSLQEHLCETWGACVENLEIPQTTLFVLKKIQS